jgi:hypothetical protein
MPVRLLVAAVAALGISSLAAAQDTRPLEPTPDRHPVTITGCYRAGILIPERGVSGSTSALLDVAEFRVSGDRAALRLLNEAHENHIEAVTGVVELPRSRKADVGIATRQVGQGRITVGRRNSRPLAEDLRAPRIARLVIEEVRHLADRC